MERENKKGKKKGKEKEQLFFFSYFDEAQMRWWSKNGSNNKKEAPTPFFASFVWFKYYFVKAWTRKTTTNFQVLLYGWDLFLSQIKKTRLNQKTQLKRSWPLIKKTKLGGDFSLLSSFFGWNATSSDPFITINFRYLRPKHLGKNHAQICYGLLCSWEHMLNIHTITNFVNTFSMSKFTNSERSKVNQMG